MGARVSSEIPSYFAREIPNNYSPQAELGNGGGGGLGTGQDPQLDTRHIIYSPQQSLAMVERGSGHCGHLSVRQSLQPAMK